ncbi:MAG: DUF3187 family protein [Desulfuromonadales bacterium]|nr:DUF3187 family protein [Desulfuromonadales bacterium]
MRRLMTTLFFLFTLLMIQISFVPGSIGFELHPLATRNLSPTILGFGLPALGAAQILQPKSGQIMTVIDLVSNSTENSTADESLIFDGETYRVALLVDYGIGENLEIGLELPLISHQSGFLDGFIEEWHDLFNLPQGIREQRGRNQLDYSYLRQDGTAFSIQSDQTGIGDLSLRGGWQLKRDAEKNRALAVRGSLKLPTGSAKKLTGSGSTDLAIWLSGEQRLPAATGQFYLYGGGGGIFSNDGDLLAGQRNNLIGFVTLGCGWQPWSEVGLQLQFDGHTPFYRHSSLRELTKFAGQLAIGGSLSLGSHRVLELAVVEDIIVDTAPDVVFHLALKQRF